jgi:hypothetical protein
LENRKSRSNGADVTFAAQVRRLVSHIDSRLTWFVGALIGIDFLFVVVFFAYAVYAVFYNQDASLLESRWALGDWSYSEMFGYLKMVVIIFLLVSIQQIWKRPIYLAFTLIFTFALLDDALRVHERLGSRIVQALTLQPIGGLGAQDLGELLVWTIVGVPLLAGAIAAAIGSPREDRYNGVLLLGMLAVLALFAVVADMVHVMQMSAFRGANTLFNMIEDGGEQVTLSLICGLVILIRRELRGRQR